MRWSLVFLLLAGGGLLLPGCGGADPDPDSDPLTTFEWDFEQVEEFVYDYQQGVDASMAFRQDNSLERFRMDGKGELIVKPVHASGAELLIPGLEIVIVRLDSSGQPRDTTRQIGESIRINGLRRDGSITGSRDVEFLFYNLFPLPAKGLEVGDSAAFSLKMPMQTRLEEIAYVSGENVLTYLRNEELDGHDCAVFTGRMEATSGAIPNDINGETKGGFSGTATYWFDLAKSCFRQVELRATMRMDISGKNGEQDLSSTMLNANDIRMKLKEIKPKAGS